MPQPGKCERISNQLRMPRPWRGVVAMRGHVATVEDEGEGGGMEDDAFVFVIVARKKKLNKKEIRAYLRSFKRDQINARGFIWIYIYVCFND